MEWKIHEWQFDLSSEICCYRDPPSRPVRPNSSRDKYKVAKIIRVENEKRVNTAKQEDRDRTCGAPNFVDNTTIATKNLSESCFFFVFLT